MPDPVIHGRSAEGLERVRAYLDAKGAPFDVKAHRVTFTAQELAAAEHVPGRTVAKVVIVFGDDEMIMAVVPATMHVNLQMLSEALGGSQVRLAHEEEFAPRFADCQPGAMPPFGNLYGMRVVVDQSIRDQPVLVLQAGDHAHALSLSSEDFIRLVKPTVAAFAEAGQ